MEFKCKLSKNPSGAWRATYLGSDLGEVSATAPSRHEVISKMRDELRYRLELCACTGETYRHIGIQIVEAKAE